MHHSENTALELLSSPYTNSKHMKKFKIPDEWWSCPAESDNGRTIIVTGRRDVGEAMNSGEFRFRIDIAWNYEADSSGMPTDADARLMEEVTEALKSKFKKDPIGIMTGIYTGDGCRQWIFYTRNLMLFQSVFNKALIDLPLIPFVISAEEDVEWNEYREMREISYIPPEE